MVVMAVATASYPQLSALEKILHLMCWVPLIFVAWKAPRAPRFLVTALGLVRPAYSTAIATPETALSRAFVRADVRARARRAISAIQDIAGRRCAWLCVLIVYAALFAAAYFLSSALEPGLIASSRVSPGAFVVLFGISILIIIGIPYAVYRPSRSNSVLDPEMINSAPWGTEVRQAPKLMSDTQRKHLSVTSHEVLERGSYTKLFFSYAIAPTRAPDSAVITRLAFGDSLRRVIVKKMLAYITLNGVVTSTIVLSAPLFGGWFILLISAALNAFGDLELVVGAIALGTISGAYILKASKNAENWLFPTREERSSLPPWFVVTEWEIINARRRFFEYRERFLILLFSVLYGGVLIGYFAAIDAAELFSTPTGSNAPLPDNQKD